MKFPFKMMAFAVAAIAIPAVMASPAFSRNPAVSPLPDEAAIVHNVSQAETQTELDQAQKQELKQEAAAVAVSAKTIHDTTDLYKVDLSIPVIAGMADERYQAQLNAKLENQAMEDLKLLKQEAAEAADDAAAEGYTFHPYEMKLEYALKSDGSRSAGGKLSLTVQTYLYSGGAHGGTLVDTYNVSNDKEAELLTLEKVLGSRYKELGEGALKQAFTEDPDRFNATDVENFALTNAHDFYLADGKVYLLFQEYEVAPFAGGIIDVQVKGAERNL
ncbi:DUF3298 and DUF4163 domain-containing protein [Paenibacillus radicis (ex Gao et al. 2016)]|uniref:DUF3298 and DUF4163 domain-containing protein n=1 Tax=Paenibacillus radicis (ex Gao et al. 2016) TaxID=1737354 RepID=A0A917HSE9_9BACL|nr:DUF3298 and DUF4163 domain-containing protein [Paenibacillus radicis (ex Gao et al. 2016)]GGG87625.1 hypothetical protein GCM10010918_52460 [Paenibacillus radicis (ex Gao et al. 2016)]